MKILNICECDFAGVAIRLTHALNQHTYHEARQLCMAKHPYGYDYDILTSDPDEIRRWLQWADLISFFVGRGAKPLAIARAFHPQHLVMTYLGSHYRRRPAVYHELAKRYGAKKQLVGVTDLTRYGGLDWLPPAIPVDEWAKMKREHKGKPVVCQSPSNLKVKHTEQIIEVLSGVKEIELLILHSLPWKQCMYRKAVADIYIGAFSHNPAPVSSIEAFSMGIPVINHVTPENEEAFLKQVGYLPYYDARLEDLPDAVDTLLNDQSLYQKYVDLGKQYVREFHDYPVVAEKFSAICETVFGEDEND